ncbi:hypothetical protein HK405_003914, partial [Cladochytrium tenue]
MMTTTGGDGTTTAGTVIIIGTFPAIMWQAPAAMAATETATSIEAASTTWAANLPGAAATARIAGILTSVGEDSSMTKTYVVPAPQLMEGGTRDPNITTTDTIRNLRGDGEAGAEIAGGTTMTTMIQTTHTNGDDTIVTAVTEIAETTTTDAGYTISSPTMRRMGAAEGEGEGRHLLSRLTKNSRNNELAPPAPTSTFMAVNDGSKDVGSVPNSLLLVIGLDPLTTEGTLYDAMKAIAPVKEVRIVKDRVSDISWGFGFVEFADIETSTRVLSFLFDPASPLNLDIDGRQVTLSYAQHSSFLPVYTATPWVSTRRVDPSGVTVYLSYWDQQAYATAYPAAADNGPTSGNDEKVLS